MSYKDKDYNRFFMKCYQKALEILKQNHKKEFKELLMKKLYVEIK